MRRLVASVLVLVLFPAPFLVESLVYASALPTVHVEDHLNHQPSAQRAVAFEYSSQDPGIAYSLFMHHASGIAVLALGVLILLDRFSQPRRDVIRFLTGCTWVLFGLFVFVMADPEGWPAGPAGFVDSFSMPTTDEWIQHKLLSLIPMLLGVYSLSTRRLPSTTRWTYLTVGVALLGGFALLLHQHGDHSALDVVNFQHRIFALTGFFVAGAMLMERCGSFTWKSKRFFVPAGIMFLGLQLSLYVE